MTIRHALTAAAGNTGPAPAPTDPQFNYVSMLLHGDGTNGAQNNTFVPTPITAPASGYYAGYFDGTGDYLTVAAASAIDLTGTDFTIEAWVYPGTQTNSVDSVFGYGFFTTMLYRNGSTWSWEVGNGSSNFFTLTGTCTQNTWQHVALTRSGNTYTMWVNGVSASTTTNANSPATASRTLAIGVNNSASTTQCFTGYISNFRIVKGTAVYTANFTPPTAPLTAISGTSLLTCMSGFGATFSDLSTNNFTITRFGNATMTGVATTPPGAAPFSASLPGSPSYVTVGGGMPSGAGTAFTMECWIYITSLSDYNAITRGDLNPRLDWGVTTSGSLQLDSVTVANICSSATGVITANTWYHVAVTRSTGNVYKLWVNGTNVATSSAFGTSMTANTTIGYSSFSSSHFFKGRISNFRVATSEVYTANFAPPSAPLTAISGTSLLTFQNATFLDNSPNAYSVTANGSATITSSNVLPAITRNGNTTQGSLSPYGNLWSNWFSGSSSWLNTPNNAALAMGTGDFTWECFVYLTQANSYGCIFDSRVGGTSGGFFVGYNSPPTTFMVYISSVVISTATLPALNTWQHICLVRQGTTLSLFINGARVGTATNSTDLSYGVMNLFGNGNPAFGYLSNVRIVKGTAVYNPSNTTLTVPTTPLTAISGTSLLTCQSNRFIDNSANNFTITRNGDVRVTKEAPFLPTAAYSTSLIGGSGYFDGTGDYVAGGSNAAFALPGAFTFECWFYPNTFDQTSLIGDTIFSGVSSGSLTIARTSSGAGNAWGIAETGVAWRLTTTTLPTNNSWNHMVAVRDASNNTALFLNGVRVASSSLTTSFGQNGFTVGSDNGSANSFLDGYLSNVRLVKGVAVYSPTSTTLTVPTAPLTAPINTSLLLNFTNAGIFDNAAENDLETVGNAQISTSVKKYGTGSIAFDGTGDWLLAPDSPNIQLGAGTFTIECWVYRTTSGSSRAIAGKGASITTGWEIGLNSSDLFFFIDGSTVTSSALIPLNTWTHVAVVRTPVSNGTTLYVNGVSSATTTSTTNFNDSGLLYVGAGRTGRLPFTGYIDDLRITKGYARYTSNFTPPTAAFPDQ